MAEYLTNDTDLTTVADAIRAKGGTTESLTFPNGFADAIGNISSGMPGAKLLMEFDTPSNWTGTVDISAPGYDAYHTMILLFPSTAFSYGLAMAFLVNRLMNEGSVSSQEGGYITADIDPMADSFGDTIATLIFHDGAVETWRTYYRKGYVFGIS